ncbi:MAG: dihydroorotate dehydrogenase electron transfer subunit [bacterium]
MIQDKFKIVANDKIAPEYYKMAFTSQEIANLAIPGQFIHIKVSEGYEPLLRRPFSIHAVMDEKTVEILYRVVGKGTALLSEKKTGQELDVLGPLGNGFKINKSEVKNSVMVGGGAGIAPLFFLTQRLINYSNITVLIGAKTKKGILCEQEFKDLGVAVQIATEDGSYGYKGLITDLLNSLPPATIFACGPSAMFPAITNFAIKNNLPTQLSLESTMACGVGACLGCVIKGKDGYKKVCKDGPVFSALEIVLC